MSTVGEPRANRGRMVDVDLRKLRVLRELERRQTISAVAEALHLTASAVSQQISSLSRDLGVPLTEPVGRRIRLTGAARLVLEHAEQIFAQVEQMYAQLANYQEGGIGEVTITGFAGVLSPLVLPAVGILKREQPELRTVLTEVDPPVSFDKLARGETDVVIAAESASAPVTDTRFHKVPLMSEGFDVALPVGHPLADAAEIALADLAEEAWIFATVGMCQDIPLAAFAAAGFTPRSAHAIGDWHATFTAVGLGMGICLVPQVARPATWAGVVLRPFADAPSRNLFAMVREGSQTAPEITSALGALRGAAREAAADVPGCDLHPIA
ncbi:LysR family transcriptional regulator [Kitasatospora sp. HPMI-4]|uniref:LysR family transcriptional regulator n=1 Tax=Kitasatospora sp. HPMI-4 TaxID=3448443 RepID=UPI003F1B9BAA